MSAPRPAFPATGMMMPAPWAKSCSAIRRLPATSEKSPTKEPFSGSAGSQPRSSTPVPPSAPPVALALPPLSALYRATPCAKPSMKPWTAGVARPP